MSNNASPPPFTNNELRIMLHEADDADISYTKAKQIMNRLYQVIHMFPYETMSDSDRTKFETLVKPQVIFWCDAFNRIHLCDTIEDVKTLAKESILISDESKSHMVIIALMTFTNAIRNQHELILSRTIHAAIETALGYGDKVSRFMQLLEECQEEMADDNDDDDHQQQQ